MCGFFTCRRSAAFRETNWVPRTEVRGYHLSSLRDCENGMYLSVFSPTRSVPASLADGSPTAFSVLQNVGFSPTNSQKRAKCRLISFFLSP